MPKTWMYMVGLFIPLIFSVLILRTPFLNWLWYQGFEDSYRVLSQLTINQPFLTYLGSWSYPIFAATMFGYWLMEHEDEAVASQFLLLPIAYVPFSIAVTMISRMQVELSLLYIHPLVIIPVGYVYIAFWYIFVWLLEKIRLVN